MWPAFIPLIAHIHPRAANKKDIALYASGKSPRGQFARDDRVKWDYSGEDVANRASTGDVT